jgi:hypothetical protein
VNLDEEADRLAAAHPWARTGAVERSATQWQPQHAVPRRPTVAKPLDWEIESRVMADLAAIDRELDPQTQAFDPVQLASMQTVGGVRSVRNGHWGDPATWTVDLSAPAGKLVIAHTITMSRENFAFDYGHQYAPAPAPPKQRKPKTYVVPGRKQGKTWIARLEQSKQARARTN